MSKKPTIQDIAKHAGVSPATVSRVLNKFDYVSEEKRQTVVKAMEQLDYRPSFSARHMRTQRSQIIGLLTDEVATTPHAVDIIRGAQEAAWKYGKILMLINTGTNLPSITSALNIMLEREVEGIIYAAMWHHAVEVPAIIKEIPVILANCFVNNGSLPAFVPDEVMGGYVATHRLIGRGHTNIAMINIDPDIPASIGRLQGYKKAHHEAGLPFRTEYVVGHANTSETGYFYTSQLLTLDPPPTAIFAGADPVAVGVYDALKEAGFDIGKDISVVSFDNQELITTSLRPSLSSVQLPHYEMGYRALEYLVEQGNRGSIKMTEENYLVPCYLIERESI